MDPSLLNYTPLSSSKKSPLSRGSTGVHHKEAEPLAPHTKDHQENHEQVVEEKVEMESPSELGEQVEIVPEKPEVDQNLEDQGIQAVSTLSFFVKNKKIELPISPEEVEQGLHKPLTSGWRWLSELAEYILHKFHMTIKKVAGVFQVVENK